LLIENINWQKHQLAKTSTGKNIDWLKDRLAKTSTGNALNDILKEKGCSFQFDVI
jgi:hypothetical protein